MLGSLEPYDGVAKLWWNTKEELQHVVSTSAGRHAASELLDDEKRFIDFSRSSVWLAIELPQVNQTPEDLVAMENSPIVALFYCFRHLPTLSLEEAQLHWRMQHSPLVRAHAHAVRIRRYLQVHRLDDPLIDQLRSSRGPMEEPYTGHAELWFDRQELMTALSSPEGIKGVEAFLAGERVFIDFSRSALWLAKEPVFIDR
jgi:hypothetical protein